MPATSSDERRVTGDAKDATHESNRHATTRTLDAGKEKATDVHPCKEQNPENPALDVKCQDAERPEH